MPIFIVRTKFEFVLIKICKFTYVFDKIIKILSSEIIIFENKNTIRTGIILKLNYNIEKYFLKSISTFSFFFALKICQTLKKSRKFAKFE